MKRGKTLLAAMALVTLTLSALNGSPPSIAKPELNTVATPQFFPAGGTYVTAQTVRITTEAVDASIRYTTDGSEPTSSHGTLYSDPVDISTTTTLKAVAYTSGLLGSAVATAEYMFSPVSTLSGLTMIYVPSGTFQRDSTATNVTTVSAFWMSQYPITRVQYLAIMGTDPSDTPISSGTNDPVQWVSWV